MRRVRTQVHRLHGRDLITASGNLSSIPGQRFRVTGDVDSPRWFEAAEDSLDDLRRTPRARRIEDLLDDADVRSFTQPPHAGAHLFAGNRERNDDHLTAMAGDAVATGVQVIDEEFAAI